MVAKWHQCPKSISIGINAHVTVAGRTNDKQVKATQPMHGCWKVAALDEENEEGDKGEESEEVEEGDEDQVIKVKEVEIAKKVTVCLWRCFFFPLKGGWGCFLSFLFPQRTQMGVKEGETLKGNPSCLTSPHSGKYNGTTSEGDVRLKKNLSEGRENFMHATRINAKSVYICGITMSI